MKSLIISKTMLKMWQREINKIFDTTMKRILAILFFLFTVTIAAIIGYSFTGAFLKAFLTGREQSLGLLATSMSINASIFTSLLFVLIKVRTPEQDRFSMQLSWLPLTTFQKSLGYFIPIMAVVSSIILFIIGILLIPNFIINRIGIGFSIGFFAMIFVQTIFVLSFINLIYNITYMFILKIKFPLQKFFSLFVLLVLVSGYILAHFNINKIAKAYQTFDYHFMYFSAPFFLSLQGIYPEGVNYFILTGFILFTIICAFMSMSLMPIMSEKRSLKLLSSLPFPSAKGWSLLVKEIKSQVRNEENILNFILLFIIIVFVKYRFNLDFSDQKLIILSAFSGLIAFNSFGNDRIVLPVYKTIGLKPSEVVLFKYCGLVVIGMLQVFLLALFTWTAPESFIVLLQSIGVLLNSCGLFYLVGILLPLDRNNPYTGIFSFGMLIIMMIPIFFIGNYLIGSAGIELQWIMLLCFELLLLFVIHKGFKWRYEHDSAS
ncbi:hypothetical protein [Bacillus gobiensis]|uniref:hypothetical protein n=1 Tax=Bacillus gobiensis TaxID=1441095 RepID=UPI003D2376BB